MIYSDLTLMFFICLSLMVYVCIPMGEIKEICILFLAHVSIVYDGWIITVPGSTIVLGSLTRSILCYLR